MKLSLFDQIHRRHLIYNQCWEDPSVDREALTIGPDDRIVMITSAGCNALDYLLQDPQHIDCVDMNPHQTALAELKLAAFEALTTGEFFAMFGMGRIWNHLTIYQRRLRPLLGETSRKIWDRRIDYFHYAGPGLYFHGTAGVFARAFNFYIDSKGRLRQHLKFFQTIRNLDSQAHFYRAMIAPNLWTPALKWILRHSLAMTMLGVPPSQIRHIQSTSGDLSSFIVACMERLFTTIPIEDNYFWRVYMNGYYTPDCCPSYLKRSNFELLRSRTGRIQTHTMSLTDFLRNKKNEFTIFVLLDHMDWLTERPALLQEEWNCILQAARPGARIIFRSGGESFDHLPEFARSRVEIHSETSRQLHSRDRVGTYGSFHLASLVA